MAGKFRQKMNRGRRKLHEHMSVPALYLALPYDVVLTPVQEITVRVHDNVRALGDLKGTNFNYAETLENSPRIVFLREEITPKRNMVVSVEAGVAYQIDTVEPSHGVTVTALVSRLSDKEAAGLPVPDAGGYCP